MLGNISDLITFSRICFTPIIVILMLIPNEACNMMGWYLFLIAGLSDILDGYIARRFGTTSRFGSLFDSYADKILIIIMLFLLVVLNRLNIYWGIVPAFIITCRELFVFLLRFYAHCKQINMGVNYCAKLKTFFEMISLICLLHPIYSLKYQALGIILLWIGAILAIISGIIYLIDLYRKMDDTKID